MFRVSAPFPSNTRSLISTKVETRKDPCNFGNSQVTGEEVSEPVQQLEVLAAKPGDLSLIPHMTHVTKERINS